VATNIVLKLLLLLLSLPFVLLSRIAEIGNLWKFKYDLMICLGAIDDIADDSIPKIFLSALIAAEDKRSAFHPGVDPIGIGRAIYARLAYGKLQGASTIEQQFVRVVVNRYEVTIPRKIREQMLAIAVSRRRRKDQIACAYLGIAHYGYGLSGMAGLRELCGSNLELCSLQTICEAIARLKYPEPRQKTGSWRRRIFNRVGYMINRVSIDTGEVLSKSETHCSGRSNNEEASAGMRENVFLKRPLEVA